MKLLAQSIKALCYSTGHEISTNEFVRERRPAKDPQGTAGRHLCPHRAPQQLGHGAPQWLGERRRHAKRRWGASRLKGSTCPQIAEGVCLCICINRGMALFPLDLPLKQVEENQRWVLTFSSVQWSSRREPRRGTGTRTHLPVDGMTHQELPGQSTLLFPFSASTAAPLGGSLVFPSCLLIPHKKKKKNPPVKTFTHLNFFLSQLLLHPRKHKKKLSSDIRLHPPFYPHPFLSPV